MRTDLVIRTTDNQTVHVDRSDDVCVATFWANDNKPTIFPSGNEAKEYASLFQSAPNLLQALEAMLKSYTDLADCGDCGRWDYNSEPEVIAARAAIAKAKGGRS
jgi:hypothetical protein